MTHTIVMAEWTRNCEPNHESREKFLWHQMLLSLMYDEVMAQDQTIVNSKRIANWVHKDSTFPLLRELFECNGVGILKRSIERYPQELKEIALSRPVFARATHISKFSANNDGTPVTFSQSQLSFHAKLDGILGATEGDKFSRDAGLMSKTENIMTDFGIRLKNILTDRSYANWLKTTFSLDEEVVDDFAELMDKPEEAIRRFESVFPGKIVRYTAMDGSVEFSTAVAVQIAGLYGEHAPGFQSLIETVFVSVFCEHEERVCFVSTKKLREGMEIYSIIYRRWRKLR